jgi:hypothetical protein
MPEYVTGGESVEAFDRSRGLFESLAGWLAGPEAAELTHDELEAVVVARDRELMRALMQDHADLRAVREQPAEAVTGADQVVRGRVSRGCERSLVTVFGAIRVARLGYRAAGAGSVFPADAAWNMPVGAHSAGLRRLAAIEAARGSFEAAQAAIERAAGVRVGKRQLEQTVVAVAVDVESFYRARRPCPAPGKLGVITCDGKGVVMRPEALRPATAAAAAVAQPKLAARVSPGEKPHRKRMAELACVYDLERVGRTREQVMAGRGDPGCQRRPKPEGKWLTGSVADNAGTVIAAAFDEAARRDPGWQRKWVALLDGNNHQIDVVETQARQRKVKVDIIVDFIHVAEYIWGAAWSFFGKGDPDAESWAGKQLSAILDGRAADVAAGIRRRATRGGYSRGERASADACADYLTSKAAYLRYDLALAHGWPIATGVIEGACRHLVQDRLSITGSRWGLAGAEAVLCLRAVLSNGDFDEYFRYHQLKEQYRNHDTHYQLTQSDYVLAG